MFDFAVGILLSDIPLESLLTPDDSLLTASFPPLSHIYHIYHSCAD